MFKPCGTLGGCVKLKKRNAWFFHPFTPKPTDGRPMTQHVRTPPGHERFAFDDRRRLGTTRRATQS